MLAVQPGIAVGGIMPPPSGDSKLPLTTKFAFADKARPRTPQTAPPKKIVLRVLFIAIQYCH
jgi:hypothetical protein